MVQRAGRPSVRSEVIVVYQARNQPQEFAATFQTLTGWLATALSHVRSRQHDRQQLARQWRFWKSRLNGRERCKWTSCSRELPRRRRSFSMRSGPASFSGSRATHTLVGRPALGVEGGETPPCGRHGRRRTSRSFRPAAASMPISASSTREIDRRVDQRLKFQTRSLPCVPLRGKNGELFGEFELINKLGGNFTADDEEVLVELATHAAAALENTQHWEDLASAAPGRRSGRARRALDRRKSGDPGLGARRSIALPTPSWPCYSWDKTARARKSSRR